MEHLLQQQLGDFRQGEADILGESDDRESLQHARLIASLTADANRCGNQRRALIVPERRLPEARLPIAAIGAPKLCTYFARNRR